ncbi:MAG: signal peptidase II [Janthinobacterium lividum]
MHIFSELKKIILSSLQANGLIIKLVILDQITKWWLINYFLRHPGGTIKTNFILNIVPAWNHGISFGYLGDFHQYSSMILAFINFMVVIYLWNIFAKSKSLVSSIGYSSIIGGALGNIIDRLTRGAVFDFIHFHYDELSFPIFNLADIFISIGSFLLIYNYYQNKKAIEQEEDTEYDASGK